MSEDTDTLKPDLWEKLHQKMSYQTFLLGVIALLASAILSFAHMQTRDVIAQRLKEDLLTSLAQVIPENLHDNELTNNVIHIENNKIDVRKQDIEIYRAIKNNTISAVAFEVAQSGYSGPIVLVLGIDHQGILLGVRVITHTETPGLGDGIEIEKSDWITHFDNRTLKDTQWAVKKDGGEFDQFTGATITPRTVINAIQLGLEFFQENKSQLLDLSEKNLAIPDQPKNKDAIHQTRSMEENGDG